MSSPSRKERRDLYLPAFPALLNYAFSHSSPTAHTKNCPSEGTIHPNNTTYIKPGYKIQPTTPSQHPASSSFPQKHQHPRSPAQYPLMTWPSLVSSILQAPSSPWPREGQQNARMILKSVFSFPSIVWIGKVLLLSRGRTTWEQLLGTLLTQGRSTGRGKHTLSSPLYPSNGITCILQPVTDNTAQTDFPASVSKTTLKEPHAGVYPSAALGFGRIAL